MANPEHLAMLKQGVEAWNQWREDHPRRRPNLSDADLPWQALDGIRLRCIDGTRRSFQDADRKSRSQRR
jgi:hypothetical protein